MTESTSEAMARLGGQYAAGRTGWSHYDACPVAHDPNDPDDCVCAEINDEYEAQHADEGWDR